MQIPAQFAYARAENVAHALDLLRDHGPDARVIAGGHSLLPMMKLRLARPEALVDINDLFELDFIVHDGDVLRVGAMTRHATLLASAEIGAALPIFHDAEKVIADPVVRNRGTIGGSLCQADPAEDLSTVCDVLDALCVVRGRDGERTVPIGDFYHGPYETAVGDGELLTELRFPLRPGHGSAYHKVERRVGDWAVAAAGVAVWLDGDAIGDCRIGLTAVGLDGVTATQAEDVVRGQPPSEQLFAEAARLAAEACDPTADQRGPVDYKRHLAGELTTRALRVAVERALRAEQ
ncbi:xanthine dehydrogenase family protein subunit M [soil metagenome]